MTQLFCKIRAQEVSRKAAAQRIARMIVRDPAVALHLRPRRKLDRRVLEILLSANLPQEIRAKLAENPHLLAYML